MGDMFCGCHHLGGRPEEVGCRQAQFVNNVTNGSLFSGDRRERNRGDTSGANGRDDRLVGGKGDAQT